MSRSKTRKNKDNFIQLKWELYDTKMWREMHWYSKLAYLRIKRKYRPVKGEQITVSYREMLDEMTMPTFAKAIKELSKNGLIEITQKGGLYRRRNYYILSENWRDRQRQTVPPLVDIHQAKGSLASEWTKMSENTG